MNNYGLDPAHFYTTPGISFQACLKMTGVRLQLFSEPEMHLFVENSIRGGVSVISHLHAVANNDYTCEDVNETEQNSFIFLSDANNLYGHSVAQALPTSDFRFLSREEIDSLDITNEPEDGPVGYILEVDLEYPSELHDLHNDFPLAPEKLVVTEQMLSSYASSFLTETKKHVSGEKLIQNLNHKNNYVTHFANLKLYIRLGMKLTRIHRVLRFEQIPSVKSYIDFNTEKRRQAKTDFERDFYKLLNNSVFGKTMENARNRVNVVLCDDANKAKKLIAQPTFQHVEIINPELVMIHRLRAKIHQTKPIYTGFSILELSKIHMYRFHYDIMLAKYSALNCRLLFSDTDSLCYHIVTEDLYRDLVAIADDSELYSPRNAKVLGKFKDESSNNMEVLGQKPEVLSVSQRQRIFN